VRVVVFGATGMVGAGVLQECLADPRIESALVVGRSSCGIAHPKLQEVLHADFFDLTAIVPRLLGFDTCFFCLGVSSTGMAEADYRRLTYDLTLTAARALLSGAGRPTFCYVSGDGTDSTERGRMMWARVKGATENALLRMPFKAAYMFRPGYIQPLRGVTSKTRLYQALYTVLGPLYPLLRRIAPRHVTTTVALGRAMIEVALHGGPKPILDSDDINRLGETAARP
jgi:uncharacterized protein YbjT (DUF2867 family)